MPVTFEQKVVIVPATAVDINTAITTEAGDDWLLGQITLSGTDVILMFSKTIITP